MSSTQFAGLIAQEVKVAARSPMALTGLPLTVLARVIPIVREMAEIQYQANAPFVIDGAKFAAGFDFAPTPHREAIQQTLAAL
ncbi:hypothetical protein DEMA109039_19390 [Deinococcus marmoris]